MIARPTSGEVANPAAASASISVDLPEPGPPVTTWSESVLIARPRDSAAPYPLFQRLQRLHQAHLDSGGSQVRYRGRGECRHGAGGAAWQMGRGSCRERGRQGV